MMREPSAYKEVAGDRVNVCLEATEEALATVAGWEAAAAKMAAKQAPAMFGKPLTEAQLLERFQSCLKTSAQGVKFVKLSRPRWPTCASGTARVSASSRPRASGAAESLLRCSPVSYGS